jgi:ribonuclease P protein component
MLKEEYRLKTNFEYNITRKHGKRYSGKYFYINVLKPRNYEGPTKFGVVVTTKIHKRAVKRNRVRRLFVESFRHQFDPIKDKGVWISVYPKASALNKTYEEINTDLTETLQKISFS